MKLTAQLGDTKTFTIPLRWGNRAFDASAGWGLTFTAKADTDTADSECLFQKSLGAGITLANAITALVSMIRVDTYRLADELDAPNDDAFQADPGTYYWDIQATGTDANEGLFRTVARGTLTLARDVTRGGATSVTIFTTEPPFISIGEIIDGGAADSEYGNSFVIDGNF